jgi:hypothetical protein
MSNVVMTDVQEEKSSHPSKQRPIDGGNGPAEESPLFLSIMWNCRVGVVEKREHDDPVQVH